MDMQRFYVRYNLGKERFARLFGAGKGSILKYEKNDPTLRPQTKERIEKAIRVIEKYNLVHPEVRHNFEPVFMGLCRRLNEEEHDEYAARFKELYEKES